MNKANRSYSLCSNAGMRNRCNGNRQFVRRQDKHNRSQTNLNSLSPLSSLSKSDSLAELRDTEKTTQSVCTSGIHMDCRPSTEFVQLGCLSCSSGGSGTSHHWLPSVSFVRSRGHRRRPLLPVVIELNQLPLSNTSLHDQEKHNYKS